MDLLDGLARGMQRGPTLLLPCVPDSQQMLETVRLYDPRAQRDEGMIRMTDGVTLLGPIEVAAPLAECAGLPPGWSAAYLSEQDSSLIRGLAHRLGGCWFRGGQLAPMREAGHHRATIYLPTRPEPRRLAALLRLYAHPVQHSREPAGVEVLDGIAHTQMVGTGIEMYTGARIAALVRPAAQRPFALGDLGSRQELLTCDLAETNAYERVSVALARDVASAALMIAGACGGVVLDCDGFRIVRPEDMLRPCFDAEQYEPLPVSSASRG